MPWRCPRASSSWRPGENPIPSIIHLTQKSKLRIEGPAKATGRIKLQIAEGQRWVKRPAWPAKPLASSCSCDPPKPGTCAQSRLCSPGGSRPPLALQQEGQWQRGISFCRACTSGASGWRTRLSFSFPVRSGVLRSTRAGIFAYPELALALSPPDLKRICIRCTATNPTATQVFRQNS